MARKREENRGGCRPKRHPQKSDKRNNQGDGKGDDVEALKAQLTVLGLTLREVPGDGNCLFRALGDQLEGHMGNHYRLRKETTDYMCEHKDDFQPFVEDNVSFEKHIGELSQLGTYAGNDAIVAFARLHQVVIVIHQPNAPVWQIKGWEAAGACVSNEKKKSKHGSAISRHARQLHIAYHGGDHYDSVRKLGDTSHLPANIVLNVDESTNSEACGGSPISEKDFDIFESFIPEPETEIEDATELEVEAMIRSGCEDLFLAREILHNNCGNLDAAVEDLIAISQETLPKKTKPSTKSAPHDLPETTGKAKGNLNKKQLEKIRKHERKRANENRKKSHKSMEIADETIIVSKVQCLNI